MQTKKNTAFSSSISSSGKEEQEKAADLLDSLPFVLSPCGFLSSSSQHSDGMDWRRFGRKDLRSCAKQLALDSPHVVPQFELHRLRKPTFRIKTYNNNEKEERIESKRDRTKENLIRAESFGASVLELVSRNTPRRRGRDSKHWHSLSSVSSPPPSLIRNSEVQQGKPKAPCLAVSITPMNS